LSDEILVSIVIPSYNLGHYLRYALESVLAQTYGHWQAIVVDDGSTDNTAEVIKEFSDPRLTYLYQANRGVSAARNAGILRARGEYLAFLDADDEWEPEFLARCVDAMRRSNSPDLAGVYTAYFNIDQYGRALPQVHACIVPASELRSRLLEGPFIVIHGAVLRKRIVQRIGAFDPKVDGLEDWDFWLRLSSRYALNGIPERLARYRVSSGSQSSNHLRTHGARMRVLQKHFGCLDDPADQSEERKKAYGYAYRWSALELIQDGQADKGWDLLAQAAAILPEILERLDTYYELAVGDQPRGLRGQAHLLDIDANGRDMLARLDRLLAEGGPELRWRWRAAHAQAYLALGMLSDQAGRWDAARGYFASAMASDPRLLKKSPVLRRLVKVCAGQQLVHFGRLAVRKAELIGHGRA